MLDNKTKERLLRVASELYSTHLKSAKYAAPEAVFYSAHFVDGFVAACKVIDPELCELIQEDQRLVHAEYYNSLKLDEKMAKEEISGEPSL